MTTTSFSGLQFAMSRSCIPSSQKIADAGAVVLGGKSKIGSWNKLASACHIASVQPFGRGFTSSSIKSVKSVTKAMTESSAQSAVSGLPINLKGKRAFIAGVADDNGYGWAIAKSLAAAGAEILVGTWVPALNIFESSLRRGKFDESRVLPDGSLMEITKVYPLDAVFDNLDDVPEDIKANKRYAGSSKWTVQEVAESVKEDFGSIDILVHSLANGPEVTKPLLETSRKGYLAAISASSYSYVSLLKHFLPILNPGIYGGGMSSAKAALESDTRVLAFEAGRKRKIRVNTISADMVAGANVCLALSVTFCTKWAWSEKYNLFSHGGPLRSRAAKAIGFIDMMIDYSSANAPLQKELSAEEVGNTAAFLASPLASAITGTVLYVDNGLNAMGVGVDSPIFKDLDIPKDQH
ncbi:Enoyl-[acyl-carrier-protein] reductase [NADH], chloroplastic [Glycine soja]